MQLILVDKPDNDAAISDKNLAPLLIAQSPDFQ